MHVTFFALTDEWGSALQTLGVPAEASSTTATIFAADYETVEVFDAAEGVMMQARCDLRAPGRYAVTLRYPLVVDAELAASILTAAGYEGVALASE